MTGEMEAEMTDMIATIEEDSTVMTATIAIEVALTADTTAETTMTGEMTDTIAIVEMIAEAVAIMTVVMTDAIAVDTIVTVEMIATVRIVQFFCLSLYAIFFVKLPSLFTFLSLYYTYFTRFCSQQNDDKTLRKV